MEYKWAAINVSNRVSGHRCHLGGRELVLFFCQRDLDLLVQQWDRLLDMVDQDSIERLGQERDAHLVCEVFVDFVVQEVLLFSYECIANFHTIDDVLLRSAFDTIVSQLKWIDSAIEKLERVCTIIHKVDFCEHANCSLTIWIDLFGNLK